MKANRNTPELAVIGLGNPGLRFSGTRHNLGFMVVDRLAGVFHAPFHAGMGPYDLCRFRYQETGILLVKPATYMNRSGIAVDDVAKRYALTPERILVVCDDMALSLGKSRIRKQGGAGGHNGLASIINYLRSDQFPRMRLGIDSVEKKNRIEFVLSPFASSELQQVELMVTHACEAVRHILGHGIERTMNIYN